MFPARLKRLMLQAVQGMTLGTLAQVLVRNRLQVDWRCWDRFLYLTALGCFNSVMALFEKRCNHYKIEGLDLVAPPVFILGHWRSGTTHLHNLLSLDENLYAPSAFQAMFPHHLLYSKSWGAPLFDRYAPKKRPMDDVAFFAHAPHEDEFALAGLCAVSPYLSFLFPVTGDLPFSSLDPLKLPPGALDRWKAAFIYLLKKLTFHKGKRLVLKSPPHTGRVRVLLDLFPEAKFVHLVRNPYEVFLSTRKLWFTSLAASHLQIPEPGLVEERIFSWYKELHHLYSRDRELIPPGNLMELKYEDLVRQPRETLSALYERLNLSGYPAFWERASHYLDSLRHYRPGHYRIDAATRENVACHWAQAFAAYGYPLDLAEAKNCL
jgi:hypothetical protein